MVVRGDWLRSVKRKSSSPIEYNGRDGGLHQRWLFVLEYCPAPARENQEGNAAPILIYPNPFMAAGHTTGKYGIYNRFSALVDPRFSHHSSD